MAEITLTQGQRIRYARERIGMEQDELARLLKVSRPALSAWERDKNKRGVSFNDLEAIAKHTDMPIEFFLGAKVVFASVPTSVTQGYLSQLNILGPLMQVSADECAYELIRAA